MDFTETRCVSNTGGISQCGEACDRYIKERLEQEVESTAYMEENERWEKISSVAFVKKFKK